MKEKICRYLELKISVSRLLIEWVVKQYLVVRGINSRVCTEFPSLHTI